MVLEITVLYASAKKQEITPWRKIGKFTFANVTLNMSFIQFLAIRNEIMEKECYQLISLSDISQYEIYFGKEIKLKLK